MAYVVVGTGGERDPDDPHKWQNAAGANCIFVFAMDAAGSLTQTDGPIEAGVNPMWITSALVGGNRVVYSVDMENDDPGIRSYRLDSKTGKLTPLNKVPCGAGAGPCHIEVCSSGGMSGGPAFLVVANYEQGSVKLFPIDSTDGSVQDCADTCVHSKDEFPLAHGRQEAPHPHGVTAHKEWVYVCDLGKNAVLQYSLDCAQGTLTHQHTTTVHESAGPRHIVFSTSGDGVTRAFAVNELDNTVTVFGVAPDSGVLTVLKHCSTLPAGWADTASKPFDFYDAPSHAAEITVDPANGRIIVTNRGHDSIAMLDFDGGFVGTVGTEGRIPWTVAVVPGDEGLYVATNQFNHSLKDPGSVAVLQKDKEGVPVFVGTKGFITLQKVMCAHVATVV